MKFVTLTYYRSGSSFFQRLINSHPDIKAAQELMSEAPSGKFNVRNRLNNFYTERQAKTQGFKLVYDHIVPEIFDYIKEQHIKIIHFIRKDLLETAMFLPQCYEGEVEGGMGPPLVVKGSITLKIDEVLHYMDYIDKEIEKYRNKADFTLTYKQVTGGEAVNYFYDKEVKKKLLDFFGLDDHSLKSDVNKKNVRVSNDKVFTNWNEMLETIKKKGVKRYVQFV